MNQSIISQCEELIREIVNKYASKESTKPFLESITKYLKFSNPKDWNSLCSLLDLFEDTELAKENFRKFGISGPTKYDDAGEKYLRLYGILNTIYLQQSAIVEFLVLVKHNEINSYKKKLKELKLIELRNIAGSHTVNFLEQGVKNSYHIQRSSLDGNSIRTLDSNNKFSDYNLNNLIIEYNKIASEIILMATEKFVRTVFKNGGKKKDEYMEKVSYIRKVLNGEFIIRIEISPETLTTKIKRKSRAKKSKNLK